jgi:predicted ArsR family transcriptional regulator
MEMQIDILRKSVLDRELITYKVLKEQLGEKGEALHYTIKETLVQYALQDMGIKLDFENIKRQAGEPDKILGYRVERDYDKPDELQISMLNCPFWERAKRYGLEKEICKLICDWETKQTKKMGCEMTIHSKIAEGAEKCILRLRGTK